jgi:Ring finger domain
MSQVDFSEFVNDYDGWTCVICQEGDGANDSRTRHECGNHEFHTKCLEQERRRDTRCPICRFVVQGGTTNRILSQEQEQEFVLRRVEYVNDSQGPHVLRLHPHSLMRDSQGNIIPFQLMPQFITDEHPLLPFSTGHPQYSEFQEIPYGIYQTIPDRSYRTLPLIIRDWTVGIECSYCRLHINTLMHWRMINCNHHLHTNCLIANMIRNGIDIETGELFCALCNFMMTH